MKSKELPMPLVLGIVGVILVVVCVAGYMSFMKPPQQIDARTVSPVRLSDPDPGQGAHKKNIYHTTP